MHANNSNSVYALFRRHRNSNSIWTLFIVPPGLMWGHYIDATGPLLLAPPPDLVVAITTHHHEIVQPVTEKAMFYLWVVVSSLAGTLLKRLDTLSEFETMLTPPILTRYHNFWLSTRAIYTCPFRREIISLQRRCFEVPKCSILTPNSKPLSTR